MGPNNELLVHFERMLDDLSPPAVLRAVEIGGDATGLWSAVRETGFLDALAPEDKGGAGLSFAEVGALVQALGRRLVPVPIAQDMAARALLASADIDRPEGAIVLVTPIADGQNYRACAVPFATVAAHALVDLGDRIVLADLATADVNPTGVHASQGADIAWAGIPPGPSLPGVPGGLRPIAAVLRAAEIAGACDHLLTMTVAYAGERAQFGKPIGRQQAIQQQLAVMAEQTVMARMAAQLGCAHDFPPPFAAAATAKQVASAAAMQIAAIAHAVHGAIGFSEEFDLQLYTRRLYEWRMADGSEGYWADQLGRQRLASDARTTIDFVRQMA